MSVKKPRLRTKGGGAMIGLVISILFFILFLGLFAFDANRAQMCERELIAACDSASITGTAMLASYDTSPNGQVSLSIAQQLAAGYAFNMFRKSVVLGKVLSNATLQPNVAALNSVSTPNQCNVIIALGNPSNGFQGVAIGDPAGRTVEIFTAYGYQPEFLSSLPFGMKVTPMTASSFGGLPQVDAVVVFDYSGSMDDFTSVLFVRREWWWPSVGTQLTGSNGTGIGMPLYSVVTGASTGTNNLFSNYLRWNYTIQPAGSGTNVLPPQNIQATSGNTAIGNALFYTNALRANPIFCKQWLGTPCMAAGGNSNTTAYMPFKSPGGASLTLSSADYGQPPGNYKPVFVNMTGISDFQGHATVAKVSSLTPDSPLSDPNYVPVPGIPGDGHPSFWWNHRGIGGTPLPTSATTANSGTTTMPGSLLVSSKGTLPGFTGPAYEPNAWGYSCYIPYTGSSSTALTYHAGYPPQPAATNSPYLAVANDMPSGNTNSNLYFTDLVVNLVDPTNGGSSYATQPIPPITASTISNFFFTPFATTFPADEPDSRIAGKNFSFENLATVVEASRGNLDNLVNYQGACLDGKVIIRPYVSAAAGANTPLLTTPVTTSVTLTTGVNQYWQLAYERLAMLESQPYATAADGCENGFFYKLSTLADCRFGFVGFSAVSEAGSDTFGAQYGNCLASYPAGKCSSQGTAIANSHLRSGVQYYYNQSNYYYGTGGGAVQNANFVWWRKNQIATPTGGSSPDTIGQAPNITEVVNSFAPTAGSISGNSSIEGFKLPRTQLTTLGGSSTVPATALCMVASHGTGGAAPYNVAPYGDIWSATASDTAANGVWNGRPMTDTYCDEALQAGYNNFNITGTNSYYSPSQRYAARKAIVFFTDGEPTGGITGQTATNSNSVATNCKNHQIAIYTIGLNMDPTNNGTLTAHQYQFLGDGVNASYTGGPQNGLAYIASNGSRFFQCQDGSTVRSAFASIARRLSQAQF